VQADPKYWRSSSDQIQSLGSHRCVFASKRRRSTEPISRRDSADIPLLQDLLQIFPDWNTQGKSMRSDPALRCGKRATA
jgi:hypothetical protein